MLSKKRRRIEPPTIHPHNKYSENRPDFNLLASLYPSFQPYVFYSCDGRPRIDWTDFNATRELTRVLLHHDHGINWWIPDGQLCPTVPNRSNYIHWIEDLLSSDFVAKMDSCGDGVRGFDIGTGANCIYPLLGASILGWSFVGSDVTDVSLEWARRNVESNSHLSELIEIRKAGENLPREEETVDQLVSSGTALNSEEHTDKDSCTVGNEDAISDEKISSGELPVLVGVVRDGEQFDFCMCNPPFFESIEEAGRNPKTSCGGTYEEMVFPGGEQAFITRIIQDSVMLKQSFRWFTSMVGRKESLKQLARKLREVGVSIVKTTEFVQGHTSRWGLGWSFMSPTKKISSHVPKNNHQSFMLEVLATICEELPHQGILLIYLSAAGKGGQTLPFPTGRGTTTNTTENIVENFQSLDVATDTQSMSPVSSDSSTSSLVQNKGKNSCGDGLWLGSRGNGGLDCLYPCDLIPFTRRPLFLIIDSDSSHEFKALQGAEKGETAVMLLSPCSPSPPATTAVDFSRHQNGSQFTMFLTAPLQAFCHLIGYSGSNIQMDVYNSAEKLLSSLLNEWGLILATSDFLDPVWAEILSDPFLRRLLLRFIFCRAVLALYERTFNKKEHHPECLPHLPESVLPTSAACQSAILRLANIFGASSHFIYSDVITPPENETCSEEPAIIKASDIHEEHFAAENGH